MARVMTKTVETFTYTASITQKDIDGGVACDQNHCMEQIGNARCLEQATKGGASNVKVTGAKIKFRWRGYHWSADTPKKAVAALVSFDNPKTRSKVAPHTYKVTAIRGKKIQPLPPERRAALDEATKRRAVSGRPQNRLTLRERIVGLA
jgi:hypothetical protein